MAQTFQDGSNVRHKSGGPTMTVIKYGKFRNGAIEGYSCRWWNDKEKQFNHEIFTEIELELA